MKEYHILGLNLDSSPNSSLIFTLTLGDLFYSRKKETYINNQQNKKVDYYLLCESENTRSILGMLLSCGRRGGLMVSAPVSGSSVPGSSPGRGHCVVFLGKTLNSHSASLHPGV